MTTTTKTRTTQPSTDGLHWRHRADGWALFRGKQELAQLVLNLDPTYGLLWLSHIWDYDDHGWHAVDFRELSDGKVALEEWARGLV